MKKIMMLMMVALLMLGVSGQAMAAFNEGDLIRVVYSGTGAGTEYATDMGNYSSLTAPNSTTYLNDTTDTVSLSAIGAASWSNANVSYFIVSSTLNGGNGAAWTSGPTTGATAAPGQFWAGIYNGASTVLPSYNNAAIGNNVTLLQSNAGSYWTNLNAGGYAVGTMGGFLDQNVPGNTAEANLAALSTTGYVNQMLYYYGSTPDGSTTDIKGTAVAALETLVNANGQLITVLDAQNAPTTPIPAAAYLFGSGLLGLFGLRRKMVA